MKTALTIVTLVAALPVIALAQTTPGASTNATPPAADASVQKKLPPPADTFVLPQEIGPQATQATHTTVDGALVRAARAGQPWQAINPFAPAGFGDGYDNVSVDPHTRQPAGIVLVSIRFGGTGHGHR